MTSATEFSITDSGDLRITLTSEGETELERLLTQHPDWDEAEIFMELIDPQLSTGWYIVRPEQIRARTLSLILTNAAAYNENGDLAHIGAAYWYPDYEHESYATTLFKTGQLILEKANWSDMP